MCRERFFFYKYKKKIVWVEGESTHRFRKGWKASVFMLLANMFIYSKGGQNPLNDFRGFFFKNNCC